MSDMIAYGLIGLLLLYVIKISQKRNKTVGNIGESIVKRKLDTLDNNFVVLSDVRYKRCQIDHMVICHSRKLVFVIEVKYWGGVITGESNDKTWRQEYNGQVKYYDNPILQNKYHCKIVRQKYNGYTIRSIVVFVRCKGIPRHGNVVKDNELVDYIMRVYNKDYNRVIIDGESDWLSKWLKHR